MEKTKNLFTSTTVWGALLVFIAPLAHHFFGVDLDAALQEEVSKTLSDWAQLAGATLAIIGRLRATKKISL